MQKAVAKRQADAMKEMPAACRPQDRSAGQTLLQMLSEAFVFKTDECAQYHESLLIDPMWEVPPTQVII